MKPLIDARHVYLAQPPLYRIDVGKETYWALDDIQRDRTLAENAGKKASITRFKGLGEMSPDILKSTTLDPHRRATLRIAIHDGEELETDRMIGELLGKDAGARFRLIQEGAHEVDELDV
jgi:DNA gyrase/topoisomerase IV subunit B